MITIRILAVVFVMTVNVGSVSSYIEHCVSEYCFSTPGSDLTKTFQGAKSWCEENSSQLAVVTNNITQGMLAKFLSSFSTQLNSPMFINVRLDQKQQQTWFLVNGMRYLGRILDQDNNNYKLYCYIGYDLTNFKVYASHPNDSRNYICEFRGTSWCSNSSTTSLLANGTCYVRYESENLTWYQARERCYMNGGNLATFNYGTDTDYSTTYLAPFGPPWLSQLQTYWVGIRWDDWTWKSPESGNELIYTSWSKEKPENFSFQCVCVDPSGISTWSWEDCNCTSERPFVCLKIVPTTIATTTTTTTATARSTPAATTTATTSSPLSNTTTNTTATEPPSPILAIALGAGIGGVVFLILLVAIVVAAVIMIRKRRNKGSGGSESRDNMKRKGGNKVNKTQQHVNTEESGVGDVYAAVVPTSQQHQNRKQTPRDIIYSTPEFAESSTSTPFHSNYEGIARMS